MDKYDLVLDITEHPENYTAEQLAEILSEPETREIYNLLCKSESAMKAAGQPDVNAEWKNFAAGRQVRPRRLPLWSGSRAASIAVIIGASIVAVAAGIGVTVAVIGHRTGPVAKETVAVPSEAEETTNTDAVQSDTIPVNLTPVMFENESLAKIMDEVAAAYGVEVKFQNEGAATLRLYYKLDPSLPLDNILEQLNTFERINIKRNGNILTIE